MIRVAKREDAEELLKIYSYYVENTAITFEYDVPSVEEFSDRISNTLKKYPYLVLEEEGKILGYTYARKFKSRAAYDRAVETTIYMDKNLKHKGMGKKLYKALEQALKLQKITNLYACIAYPKEEDEYLTKNSVDYHQHLGYRMVGEFYNCGYKFGRWYNMVWMEKIIAPHKDHPDKVLKFDEIRNILKEMYRIN